MGRLWERLDERYGSPELVEAAIMNKLRDFPKLINKDSKRLDDLSDILFEIESVKEDTRYRSLLAYYNLSSEILPTVNKLPHNIQEKWITRAASYKKQHSVTFPPFSIFAEFIREISKVRNDPGFAYEQSVPYRKEHMPQKPFVAKSSISVKKTEVSQAEEVSRNDLCPVHNSTRSLNQCRGFRAKPLQQRKKFLSENGICYRCCDSNKHLRRTCTQPVKCTECGSDRHPTALHVTSESTSGGSTSLSSAADYGGEENKRTVVKSAIPITSKCTDICGDNFAGKACAKIILVKVYPKEHTEKAIMTYAIFDDQSNRSLAKSDLFTDLDIHAREVNYTLSSCGGA